MSALPTCRPSARLLLVAVLAGLVVSLLTASPAGAAAGKPTVPSTGLMFGMSVDSEGGLSYKDTLTAAETRYGRTFGIDRTYYRWDDAQPGDLVKDDIMDGRVPFLSISAKRRDGSKVPFSGIAAGTYDAQIRTSAVALRNTGKPMILAFHHEPEIYTGYGTPAAYAAAFRHLVTVFRQQGATNVAFAFVMTPYWFKNADQYYPGDSYVDWIGTDAYNFGSCKAGVTGWRSFRTVAQPFYDWASKRPKPLVLAEWGSASDPQDPDRRAAWLKDAWSTIKGWPRIKAAAYFNREGTCDWRLGSSGPSVTAFRSIATSAYAHGLPTARIVPDATVGAAPYRAGFTLSGSTGSGSTSRSGIASWTVSFGDGSSKRGTGQPTRVLHDYGVGTWTATLTVTDRNGRTASARATVTAAAKPSIGQNDPVAKTSTTATVPGWIDTDGLTGSYYVEWGTTTAYGNRTATFTLDAKSYPQAVTTRITGLTKGRTYHWRHVATTAAGTTKSRDRTFVQ